MFKGKRMIWLILLLAVIASAMVPYEAEAAMNWGKVNRDLYGTFDSLEFTVSSPGHALVRFRTEQLIIYPGPGYGQNAVFNEQSLTAKGFYSSGAGTDTISFSADEIAQKAGISADKVREIADNSGFTLGAVLGIYNGNKRIAEIKRADQVDTVCGPNHPTCGYTFPLASRDDMRSRWGVALDTQKPLTLTVQIEGQGSTSPVGSKAPGTVHKRMSGTVPITASPIAGWKFAQWFDVSAGSQFSNTANTTIVMNQDRVIRAVFIPDSTMPPAVTPPPPAPPVPEPPPPPPPPPDYDPVADFTISNPAPVEGQQVNFHNTSTHPGAANGESIVEYQWTIQNQPGASSENAVATWNTIGSYSVTLRVTDQDGDTDSCTKGVVVGPAMPVAVITLSTNNVVIGREITIDGEQSTAANGRTIKKDEMEWEFYRPGNTLKWSGKCRYPISGKAQTLAMLDQTGVWKVRLKVKDSKDNESTWTEQYFTVYPDQPPKADFWLAGETLRNCYQDYKLTVHDLSTEGAPDGALGDQIFTRQWTLYYDTDNNGSFDQTINPGDTGKAATLEQVSGNDTAPVIKFSKTGRYLLELTVQERYFSWGSWNIGLSDNTLDKAQAEKQVIVINLPPTVNFSIKKITPVDIQFAVDSTVSDSKLNNLLSADAGFKSTLTSAYIQPTTGFQKVATGAMGDSWITSTNGDPYSVFTKFEETPFPGKVNVERTTDPPNWWMQQSKSLDVNNGVIGDPSSIIMVLNDGTYLQGVYDNVWNGFTMAKALVSVKRVDANLNVLVDYSTAITNSKPADDMRTFPNNAGYGTFTYTFEGIYPNKDGSIFVLYNGSAPTTPPELYHGYGTKKVIKINPDLSTAYFRLLPTYVINNGGWSTTSTSVIHSFTDTNQLVFFIDAYQYMNTYTQTIFTCGDHTNATVGSYTTTGTNTCIRNATSNGKYFVVSVIGRFWVINNIGVTVLDQVSGFNYTKMTSTGPILAAPFSPGKFAVMYSGIKGVPKPAPNQSQTEYHDRSVIYILDESTGTIINSRELIGELYPVAIPWTGESGEWTTGSFGTSGLVMNQNVIGLTSTYTYDTGHGGYERRNYTAINSDLQVVFNSGIFNYPYGQGVVRNSGTFLPINNQYAGFIHSIDLPDPSLDRADEKVIGATGVVASFPEIDSSGSPRIWKVANYLYTNESNQLQLLSSNLTPLWARNLADGNIMTSRLDTKYSGVQDHDLFSGLLVLSKDKTVLLVNPSNGQTMATIPHQYLFHDDSHLVCYGIDGTGKKDGTLRCYGQLQGLQYLQQVIENHVWYPDMVNHVVSVIDGSQYLDYGSKKDTIIQLSKSNHLGVSAISPISGSTGWQIADIAKNGSGGWWFQTSNDMSGPLDALAAKIIQQVNDEKGSDNVVLVNQPVDLNCEYKDSEIDPANTMLWSFEHDPSKVGIYTLSNGMGLSVLNGTEVAIPVPSFDRAGTYKVRCKAQDAPPFPAYWFGPDSDKAGRKWSDSSSFITVIVHRRPIASFSLSTLTTTTDCTNFNITDTSYDPDLIYTDPEGKKGLRNWEWQYRNISKGEDWTSSSVIPTSFPSKGIFAIRLRVRDAHGAWSLWSDQQTFNIINSKPIAAFDALPNPVYINSSCNIIDHSCDPDGDPLVNWSWSIQGVGTFNRATPDPFPVSWPSIGNYPITLQVMDSAGAWSDPVSQTVRVVDQLVLTLQSISIQNGRGAAVATPGGNPPGPSGLNRVNPPVYPENINSNEIGAYSKNQLVTLTAETVTSGTYFVEWWEGNNQISTNTTCTVQMTQDRTITAVFKKDPIFIPAVPPSIHVYIVK